MKPIFSRSTSTLQFRFFLSIFLSVIFIIADIRFDAFHQLRSYLDTIISPFYFIENSFLKLYNISLQMLSSRNQLILENQNLHQELFLKKSDLLLLDQYKKENISLRELLGSPLRRNERKLITQIINYINYPYRDQVIIDKGSVDNVYEGQPVLSNKGIVGQVIRVSKWTSRVLLICDTMHAIPAQILRNNIRVIIVGKGCSNDLQLKYIPDNLDIRVGDILVTSGLGDKFPEGYPVAVVSSIEFNDQLSHSVIQVRPTAIFENLRYLLLIWNDNINKDILNTSELVNKVAKERLMEVTQ